MCLCQAVQGIWTMAIYRHGEEASALIIAHARSLCSTCTHLALAASCGLPVARWRLMHSQRPR